MKRFVIITQKNQIIRRLPRYLASLLALTTIGWASAAPALAQADPLSRPLTLRWKIGGLHGTAVAGASGTDRLYLVTEGGAVQAVLVGDGKLLWRSDLGGQIAFAPVASQSGVVLASESNAEKTAEGNKGQLRELTRQGGITTWATLLPSPWTEAFASSSGALFGCGRDARVQAVNRSDGRLLWTADRSVQCSGSPVIDKDLVYVSDARGEILALDQVSGNVLWRYRTQGVRLKNLATDESGIYGAAVDGTVYALTRSGGKLRWRTRAGEGTQFMVSTAEGVLVTSLDNYVYCLSAKKGTRRWKFRLEGRPLALPLFNKTSAFLLSSSGDEGIVLDLKTGRPINRLTLGPDFEPAGNPVLIGDHLVIPTRQGLLAFAPAP